MLTLCEGSSPSPKKRKFAIGNFFLPMAVNIVNEDISGLMHIEDLDAEKVRCLSQEERSCSDPKVGERDCLRVDQMVRSSKITTEERALAWECHLVKQEIVMSQTVSYVEAIKYLEEEFTTLLQSSALTNRYKQTSMQLTSIMKEAGRLLNYSLSDADLWLSLPFGVFCYGLMEILNAGACASGEDLKMVKDLLGAAKVLFMDVIKQGLDSILEKSESMGISIDNITLSYVTEMRDKENFTSTIQQWAEFAVKRHDRNTFSHPWILLDRAQKQVWFQDLQKTLEDKFSSNFRGIGYLAKLALITKDAEEGAKTVKQKGKKTATFLDLIKISRKQVDKQRMEKIAKKNAEDEALEAGQFHDMSFNLM